MAEDKSSPAAEALVGDLRRALQNLYDPARLAKSPLIKLFGVGQQPDPASALRDALMAGIEALQPADDVPPQADAWRIYSILKFRYVEMIPQREIAASLALSVRQLRRGEVAALQVLANHLWVHHGLQLRAQAADHSRPPPGTAADLGGAGDELQWLRSSFMTEATGIDELIAAALKTVSPLLEAAQVRVENSLPGALPRVAVHAIPMRQALVTILSTAARCAPLGRIEIAAVAERWQIGIRIVPVAGRAKVLPLGCEDSEGLEMARQLAAHSGGSLALHLENGAKTPFEATLILPTAQQIGVLVADDNIDTQRLFRRYLEGSRYAFIGAREPLQAVALATDLAPKVIILDVMLPGMDGWELLSRLREHPVTQHIPVIVCTILPQEQLALTLGAAAFLRKPVSRGALLAALDTVVAEDTPARP